MSTSLCWIVSSVFLLPGRSRTGGDPEQLHRVYPPNAEQRCAADATQRHAVRAAASIDQHGALDGDAVITLNVFAAGVVALYVAGSYHAVQAAEAAGTLTLACDGMKTTQPSVPDPKPEAVSIGITLDFTARRVDGFGSDTGLRITIPDVTETTITFDGSNEDDLGRTREHHIRGMINRVTSVLQANEAMWTKKTPTRIIEYFYVLKAHASKLQAGRGIGFKWRVVA